jgi:hypothetical protein
LSFSFSKGDRNRGINVISGNNSGNTNSGNKNSGNTNSQNKNSGNTTMKLDFGDVNAKGMSCSGVGQKYGQAHYKSNLTPFSFSISLSLYLF